MAETVYTGGCQCGAIRFRVEGVLKDSSICHCRMCQKAFGAYYAPLVSTRGAQLNWTRGVIKHFQSSNMVKRGFCDACGTPLTYDAPDGVAVSAGAFDDPSILPPTIQYGIEGKVGFVDKLHELPNRNTEEDLQSTAFLAQLISYQHPDHDTESWPTTNGAKP
ncbi:GFA family protein [Agrobacterium vitis]|uniref:GFA family protein n=1 Tax=Rhizobium/Agrobacterium group TaxID=227290 RepID=UPI0008FB845A|nr:MULTISPECIES: GFA family protein [Rhizobium/Agrobacterium group]MCF1434388.1 GFA family protein [Allorhizobium ampelinum]MUO89459.1 GFA family protein [Agrobacterium vitis]MUZ51601.1 GFA family protein [Agrobacterium vitis]MUZ90182.1 GFA family protein [Agrobacterium vitis]MVA39203.1 GFA family protein [Agrobacterium vitis]